MQGSSPAAEIARSPAAWERLAKDWIVEVIERTPLADVQDLPLGWIADQAPPLIAEILGLLSDPGGARELELSPSALRRAESLASQRDPNAAAAQLPRELAALQGLLVEALGRETRERDRAEFTRAASRLAEVFGAVQSAALQQLVEKRSGELEPDSQAGLEDPARLHERLHALIGEHRSRGVVFSVAHFEVDGLDRVTAAFGEEAAARVVRAVAGILDGRMEPDQRLFRIGDATLLILAPASTATLSLLCRDLATLVSSSQDTSGPLVSIAAGVASWPEHATSAEELLDAAEQAAWRAHAAGETVGVAPAVVLQDS